MMGCPGFSACALYVFLAVQGAAFRPPLLRMSTTAPPLQRRTVRLPHGIGLETIQSLRVSDGNTAPISSPPLLFIHGSFHAAWCWAEHWMPYFSQRGYDCYAISLRGTSGSPPLGSEKSVRMEEHCKDIDAWLDSELPGQRPILVSHSFGGIVAMKLLEEDPSRFHGAAFLCSVPPSGNGPMTMRFLRSRPIDSFEIVLGFVAKQAATRPALCRKLFFGDSLPSDEMLVKYMQHFKEDSRITLDLKALSQVLPSKSADAQGRAKFASQVPPVLVLGAGKDFIVDREGVLETARFLGVKKLDPFEESDQLEAFVFEENLSHDVMLGDSWRIAAEHVLTWVGEVSFIS